MRISGRNGESVACDADDDGGGVPESPLALAAAAAVAAIRGRILVAGGEPSAPGILRRPASQRGAVGRNGDSDASASAGGAEVSQDGCGFVGPGALWAAGSSSFSIAAAAAASAYGGDFVPPRADERKASAAMTEDSEFNSRLSSAASDFDEDETRPATGTDSNPDGFSAGPLPLSRSNSARRRRGWRRGPGASTGAGQAKRRNLSVLQPAALLGLGMEARVEGRLGRSAAVVKCAWEPSLYAPLQPLTLYNAAQPLSLALLTLSASPSPPLPRLAAAPGLTLRRSSPSCARWRRSYT